ncbi:MAG: T9SS type A sorting domain-containing protein [Flavobacteriales bacterium]|nr:T9SS type A sorting domain-containing protein [Flavobacteriales bacterium]MBK9535833.1 T9SS type A sorting domain-containing protein [Flavobacteriales bacterium]HQX29849.1 T9SS type A sorting domain-containing protein [Flavobacteriales bacterium]HQX36982.1 T9SS type A sorting domain-containing protein [Flavobacteriales bacterium]
METPPSKAPLFRAIQLTLTLCLPMLLLAQAYIPTLNENATWDIECLAFSGTPPYCGDLTGTGTYHISGDTTIQDVDYKIVSGLWNDIDLDERYLREDPLARKVFVLDPYGAPDETVLYDYNAVIGDSINWYDFHIGTLYSIDSITLANGMVRRRFNVEPGHDYVEGIGGMNGIGFPLFPGLGVDLALRCYKISGVPLIDPNDLWTITCAINIGIDPVGSFVPSIVSPNPSTGQITINRKTELIQTFKIIDMSGRSVHTETLSNQIEQIDLSHLQAGVYLYMLNEQDQGKLILFR